MSSGTRTPLRVPRCRAFVRGEQCENPALSDSPRCALHSPPHRSCVDCGAPCGRDWHELVRCGDCQAAAGAAPAESLREFRRRLPSFRELIERRSGGDAGR